LIAALGRATELRELGLKPGRKLKFEYAELKQSEKAQAEDVALTQHVEVQLLAFLTHHATPHSRKADPRRAWSDVHV
jgi:hypothetical protein